MPEILPLGEAVAAINAKTPIGSLLRSADWERVPLALRQRAQFSAGVTSARVLQTIQDRLAAQIQQQREQLADGKQATFDRSSFIDALREIGRAEGLTPTKEEDRGTIKDITSIPRLGLIYDMQNAQAGGFARHKLDTNEGALLLFPAYRLGESTADEPRPLAWWQRRWFEAGTAVGWEGAVKSDFVALKTSPIWSALSRFGTPWAPFDWGSTRELEEVDRTEAVALGLIQPNEVLPPGDEKFNEQLQASVRGLDAELKSFLKENLGKQVKFADDTVWWTGDRKGKELAVGKKPKPVVPPLTPPTSEVSFPETLDALKPLRNLGGSTGAKLMQDARGRLFVAKRGNSAEHAREEFTADSLYQAAGVAVPKVKLLQDSAGNPVKIAEHIEGQSLADFLRTAPAADRQRVLGKLQEHFHVDALLGNWDVAGLNHDNIIVDKVGTPWRIDNGGALRLRAQGAAKTSAEWSGHPLDFWTMRNAQVNPKTAELFGGANAYELAQRIHGTDFERIITAAPEDLRDVLRQRAGQLQDAARKALEYQQAKFLPTHADRITEEVARIREANVTQHMAAALKQTGDATQLEDASGRRFNHLRSSSKTSTTVQSDPAAYFADKILPAVKTINHHHGKGDIEYNQAKVDEALAQKAALEILKQTGNAGEKKMATSYLETLAQIEAAKGKKDVTVPQFKKFAGKIAGTSASVAEQSVVERLAEHMAARGGDWSIIENWAGSQGGSSRSNASQQLKRWLFERLEGVPQREFHSLPKASVLQSMSGAERQKYDRSFEVFHGFIQDFLGQVEFPGNDRQARLLRVLRTEQTRNAVPFETGESGVYKRGVNESGSLFKPVFSGARTITAVPHSRITSIYFLERTPGSGNTFLYGDSENEVTFMGHELRTKNITGRDPDSTPPTDHTKWQTP